MYKSKRSETKEKVLLKTEGPSDIMAQPRDVKKELNVFHYDFKWNHFYGFKENLKDFFRNIKYAYQRAKRGYCDRDLWNLDEYYCNLFSATLRDLAKNSCGYPGDKEFDTPEKWENYLNKMADCFYYALEQNGSKEELEYWKKFDEMEENTLGVYSVPLDNGFYEIKTKVKEGKDIDHEKATKNWLEAGKTFNSFREKNLQQGLDMMRHVFFNLWD